MLKLIPYLTRKLRSPEMLRTSGQGKIGLLSLNSGSNDMKPTGRHSHITMNTFRILVSYKQGVSNAISFLRVGISAVSDFFAIAQASAV